VRPSGTISLIVGNLGGWNSPRSKVTWLELKCITILSMRIVSLKWVNTSRIISGVSGPKFAKIFCSMQEGLQLTMLFDACR